MSITPRGMSIQEAYRLYREEKLIVNRKYQRKLVWTMDEKRTLIDSILKGYPIPLILLSEIIDDSSKKFEILDGMQRLNAIFGYIENSYTVDDQYFDVNEFARAKQAAEDGFFAQATGTDIQLLAKDQCANFLDYQMAITSFPGDDEVKITDIFGRINSGGKQLSAQEKRQAGMTDDFSNLVKKLASEIRGDSSVDRLPLNDMPSISIDSRRDELGYTLKAEDIFWCKQGIIWKKQLRDSEDEEIIADICASILANHPIARSKDLLDSMYTEGTPEYITTRNNLTTFGKDRLYIEIITTLSVLKNTIETYGTSTNTLRDIISPKSTNPIKGSFFALFIAFYELVIKEEKTPSDINGIMNSITGLQKSMVTTANSQTTKDRSRNIDVTKGLIQKFFVKAEPPMLRHGAGLLIDIENSLRRARVESSRYECKQGFVDLSDKRAYDRKLPDKILETLCGIANVGPDSDGFLFIGVADKKSDADRIASLDNISYEKIGDRYIVGIDRELLILNVNMDQYMEKLLGFIRGSELSDPLKSQILSQIDVVAYRGLHIIRIRVPAQHDISFLGETAYIREHSGTIELSGKKLLAAQQLFPQ